MRAPATLLALSGVLLAGAQPQSPAALEVRIRVNEHVRVSHDLPDTPHIEPHLALDPGDPHHLVGASAVIGATTSIAAFASFDGGATWSRTELPRCRLDPWVAFLGSGDVRIACIDSSDRPTILVYGSADGGLTWTGPTEVSFEVGAWQGRPAIDRLGSYDHEAIIGGPFAGRDRLYLVAMQGMRMDTGESFAGPVFLSSDDGGESFGTPRRFLHGNVWANAVNPLVLSDGTVGFGYVDFAAAHGEDVRMLSARRIWWVSSQDGGETFRAPTLITDSTGASTLPLMAVDVSGGPYRDRLYLALDEPRDEVPGVWVHASSDRGLSWTPAVRATSSDRGPFANPAIAVSDAGFVGVAWYDGRHADGDACWDLYFTASVDGGATFLPEARITGDSFCTRIAGNVVRRGGGDGFDVARRWPAGGDYFGLVGGPDGTFDLLWADSRTGSYQLWSTRVRVVVR